MDINIIEADLMSKVMNRRIGGGTSSCESSPVKQKVSLETGCYRQLESHNCLSSSSNTNYGLPVTCNYQEDTVDIDEIDGFITDKAESRNHARYDNSGAGSYTKAINIRELETDFNVVGKNHVEIDENADHAEGEYRYVLDGIEEHVKPRIEDHAQPQIKEPTEPQMEEHAQPLIKEHDEPRIEEHVQPRVEERAEPRIEMFNESDSNSNPFILSSFQSLNTNYCEHVKDMNAESDNEYNYEIEASEKSSAESSQAFPWKTAENRSITKHRSEEKEIEQGFAENRMTYKECNDTENDSTESQNEVSFDKAYKRIMDTDKIVEKSVKKKSRKQNVPKRVRKIESTEVKQKVCEGETVGFTECNKNLVENTLNQTEVSDCVQNYTDDEMALTENNVTTKYEEFEHKKLEKSRKQFQPKRIDQLENMDENAPYLNNENELNNQNEKTKAFGMPYDMNEESEVKFGRITKDECLEKQSNGQETTGTNGNKDSVHDVNVKHVAGPFTSPETLDESCNSTTNESENLDHSVLSVQNTGARGDLDHFSSLSSNPFYYNFSPDWKLMSRLAPGMLRGDPSSPGGFALDENGPENLEVIRQLREIRCNRYRKISIAEKREISAYATIHGVSQAAAYYNVSKSAVSMWTKLDFSNADEDPGAKRKNCMSGNEKFEALCRKVKNERENKFKGMSKQDKFEVSRYAKLVGVREMSRCLGVALGTVSGWMRQFPYKVETESSDVVDSKNDDKTEDTVAENKTEKLKEKNNKSEKRKMSEQKSKISKRQKKVEPDTLDCESFKTVQKDDTMYILPVDLKNHNVEGDLSTNDSETKSDMEAKETSVTESDPECNLEQKDELDKMIAETLQKPDVEKCFEDIKDMIKDSPLEGDDFFRSLFDRVIACRADKYKTLKPSEKLEVVRYAKRIGVRRVAKILGLATGTLSGWNTKYQSSLGLTDPGLDMSNKTDLLVSYLSPAKESEKQTMSPAALMDNSQNSEVTAVKLLFKDRFPTLLHKIEIAKQVKFRNITTGEKIEFVKCSKLVGIRPTARVFGIPIGTLSGWISKYSKLLHPAYHVDVDQDMNSSSSESMSSVVGRNPGIQGTSSPGWPHLPGLLPGGQGSALSISSSQSSQFSSPQIFSSHSYTDETLPLEKSNEISNDSKDMISAYTGQEKLFDNHQTMNLYEKRQHFDINKSENQSNVGEAIKTEPDKLVPQSTNGDDFEQEAKLMAQQYLQSYKEINVQI